MSTTVLNAATGRTTGSPASRRLRREEQIPAVVYGLGMEPISITIDRRELRRALSGPSGVNTILDLTVDGQVYPAIVKRDAAPPGTPRGGPRRLSCRLTSTSSSW